MKIICGLGNPGKKYIDTRHNIGFKFIDSIKTKYKFITFKKDKSKEIYKGKIKSKEFYLIKSLKYMNLSGIPLLDFMNYYKISIKNLTVIHDDIDLNIGKIKYKIGGSNAGHNGLLNIDQIVGKSYGRLRIGVSHPASKNLVSKYVLEKFEKDVR